jgi:DNA-binding beta-propeller fold protein YncE/PKD repeat protein
MRRSFVLRLSVVVAIVVLLTVSGLGAAGSVPVGRAAAEAGRIVAVAGPGRPAAVPASPVPATPAASSPTSWAGTVLSTLLPNYNASLSGLFRDDVSDWQVGSPAVVPSTGTVWWPEFPVLVAGAPFPTTAPAVLFNVTEQKVVGIDASVANASAFAYDPETGLLYATEPFNDTVEVVNPGTGLPTGVSYPVGRVPMAIAYDSATKYLFVANTGSSNVTVINPDAAGASAIVWAGIGVDAGPIALAADPADGWVYVADAGAADVSALDTSDLSAPATEIGLYYGPAGGVAFSAKTDFLAVTSPRSTNLTIINGKTADILPTTVVVGSGATSVAVANAGESFLVANASDSSVVAVDAASPFTVSSSAITVGGGPSEMAVEPGGDVLVWANTSRTIAVVASDLAGVLGSTSPLTSTPSLLAYDPTNNVLAVGDGAGSIELLDPETGASEFPPIGLPAAPADFAYEANATILYVSFSGGIRAYNLSTDRLVAEISQSGPNDPIAFDPISDLLWVGTSSGVVSFTTPDLGPSSLVTSLPVVLANAFALALDPGNGSIFAITPAETGVIQFNGTTGVLDGSAVTAGANLTALLWDPADGSVYAAGDSLAAIDPSTMALEISAFPFAPHTSVGGMAYEPSREAMYIASYDGIPGTGLLTVFNASTLFAIEDSLTVLPVGVVPSALVAVEPSSGGLADSGAVLVANEESGTISVVGSAPEILSAAFDPTEVDEGASTTLQVNALGGAGASTFTYSDLPTGCSVSGPTVSCSPTESGGFTALVTLTDAWGDTASAVASLTVASPLDLAAVIGSLPSHEADLGLAVTMSATAGGGTGGYSFSWAFGDGAVATGPSTSHAYERTGEFVVAATVTDHGGGTAVNETVVTVEPDPTVAVASSSGTATDVGLPVALSATVSGGVGAGTGTWTFGDGTTSPVPSTSHVWSRPGDYQVNFSYQDALGWSAESSLTLAVHSPLSGTVSAVPATKNPIVGTAFTFTADLENGTPGYAVTWSFGDGSWATGTSVTHAYATPGNYSVSVIATDAAGAVLDEQITGLVVGSAPSGAAPLFGGGFGPTLALGLIVGAVLAAVALFVAERGRRAGPAGPPSPYVPPPPRSKGRS